MTIVFLLLGCVCLQPVSSALRDTTSVSVQEFGKQHLQWMENHPDAAQAGKLVNLPILDLYSPSGAPIYHGTDSAENAAFLDSLPKGIPAAAKTDLTRPSLKEAIEMFPEFKEQEEALLADHRYTVFAITYPDWIDAKKQNDAVAKLRQRAKQAGIRVLEVRLHT